MKELRVFVEDKKSGREGIPLGSSRDCLGFNSDCSGCPNGKDKRKTKYLQRFS
jgi:hypothetical protein